MRMCVCASVELRDWRLERVCARTCAYVHVCVRMVCMCVYVRVYVRMVQRKGSFVPSGFRKKKVDSESRGERGGKTRGQGVATPVTTPTPSASLSLT